MEMSSINISITEGGQGKLYHCSNPATPTSVLPQPSKCNSSPKEFSNTTYLPPQLRPLRLQALANLKPLDARHLSFHMFPLVSDQSSTPSHQEEKIDNDLELDFQETPMIINPFPYIEIGDDSPGYGGKTSHFATPVSTPTSTHLPMNLGSISNDLDKHNEEDGNKTTSEATILISQNIPCLHLKAQLLSPTPTPPPSPIILTGVPMLFRSLSHRQMEIEPLAYAMTIDDDSHKPSKATMLISQPFMTSPPSSITSAEETMSPTPTIFLLEGSAQLSSSTPSPCNNIPAPAPPKLSPQPKSFASLTTPSPPPTPVALSTRQPPLPSPRGSTPPPPYPLGATKASSIPPPPPPLGIEKTGVAPPPPPPPLGATKPGSAPPPPPSLGAAKALRARNNIKLKRSSQMGNLYRLLKGKVEGSSLNAKTSDGRKSQAGSGSGGEKAQGMADALAEMTKRFVYPELESFV